jgi:N-carbamoylputrescine amidase
MAKAKKPAGRSGPAPHTVRVGLVQARASAQPADNLERTVAAIERAAAQGARIVCTQELFRSEYFCQTEDAAHFALAESVPGPTTKVLADLARRHEIVIVGSLFERRAPGLYHNTSVVLDADGSHVGTYRKMHIPDDPRFYEKYYFAPGDLGFSSFETAVGRIAVLICWDQWYPEAARLTALRGAAVIFYPTAIGWHPHEKAQYGAAQRDAWTTVQRGHAIANGVYVAAVNRVGFERPVAEQAGLEFWGTSFICDPQGVMLAQASTDNEEVLLATIDLDHLETIRRNWPFLRDRRIDAYGDITRLYIDES